MKKILPLLIIFFVVTGCKKDPDPVITPCDHWSAVGVPHREYATPGNHLNFAVYYADTLIKVTGDTTITINKNIYDTTGIRNILATHGITYRLVYHEPPYNSYDPVLTGSKSFVSAEFQYQHSPYIVKDITINFACY